MCSAAYQSQQSLFSGPRASGCLRVEVAGRLLPRSALQSSLMGFFVFLGGCPPLSLSFLSSLKSTGRKQHTTFLHGRPLGPGSTPSDPKDRSLACLRTAKRWAAQVLHLPGCTLQGRRGQKVSQRGLICYLQSPEAAGLGRSWPCPREDAGPEKREGLPNMQKTSVVKSVEDIAGRAGA